MNDFAGSNGHWVDDPDNPFNRMAWTSGGGGQRNPLTEDSNARRASAMVGVDALPRFASGGVAQRMLPAGGLAVVGDHIVRTSGPGNGHARTAPQGQGGTGPGVGIAASEPAQPKSKGSKLKLDPKLNSNATALIAGGREVPLDDGWSDGQEFEDRWGEWGGALGGLVVMGADLGKGAKDAVLHWSRNAVSAVPSPRAEEQPRYHNGWVTYDEGTSWQFTGNGSPYLWDSPENALAGSPWR